MGLYVLALHFDQNGERQAAEFMNAGIVHRCLFAKPWNLVLSSAGRFQTNGRFVLENDVLNAFFSVKSVNYLQKNGAFPIKQSNLPFGLVLHIYCSKISAGVAASRLGAVFAGAHVNSSINLQNRAGLGKVAETPLAHLVRML
jgi:hypothetical protein